MKRNETVSDHNILFIRRIKESGFFRRHFEIRHTEPILTLVLTL